MIRKYLTTCWMALLTTIMAATAQTTVNYGYYDGPEDEASEAWGTGKTETYNIAVQFNNPCLKGLKVTALRIPIQKKSAHLSAYSAFLTHELKVRKGKVEADIAKVDFTPETEWVTVPFPEAYLIGDKPFYAGYTLKVDAIDEYSSSPVVTVPGNNNQAFYVTTSRTYRSWKNVSENLQKISPIAIVLEGEFDHHSVKPLSMEEVRILTDKETTTRATIANTGLDKVENFDYRCEVAGQQYEGRIVLEKTISPKPFASTATVDIQLPAIPEMGNWTSRLTITQVNGVPNEQKEAAVTGKINVIAFKPQHCAVMEEFTGTWCGWCPRGWVAMELLKERYPDRFIALSYHYDDIMQTTAEFPASINGFPSATIDRGEMGDPYFWNTDGEAMAVEKEWLKACDVPAPANITATAQLNEEQTQIEVSTDVVFVEDQQNHPYRLSYYVTADGLTGTTGLWSQTNYYAGNKGAGEDFQQFIEGGADIMIPFNDVVLAHSDYNGIEASIPAPLQMGQSIQHSYSFALADMNSMLWKELNLVQDKNKLNVVVLIVNSETGKIENATKCRVKTDISGIATPQTSASATEIARFSTDGRRVNADYRGICIIRLSNGQSRKVMIR